MTTLTFSDETIPDTARGPAEPNPFADVIGTMPIGGSKGEDGAKSFTVDGEASEKTNAEVGRNVKRLRDAARDRGATARTKLVAVGTAKAPKTKIVFWLTEPIKRPRKSDDAASDAALSPVDAGQSNGTPAETGPETS